MLPFGAVCEKQYVYLKRNQPFVFTLPYQGSLPRGKLPDGWFYISGRGARAETTPAGDAGHNKGLCEAGLRTSPLRLSHSTMRREETSLGPGMDFTHDKGEASKDTLRGNIC